MTKKAISLRLDGKLVEVLKQKAQDSDKSLTALLEEDLSNMYLKKNRSEVYDKVGDYFLNLKSDERNTTMEYIITSDGENFMHIDSLENIHLNHGEYAFEVFKKDHDLHIKMIDKWT